MNEVADSFLTADQILHSNEDAAVIFCLNGFIRVRFGEKYTTLETFLAYSPRTMSSEIVFKASAVAKALGHTGPRLAMYIGRRAGRVSGIYQTRQTEQILDKNGPRKDLKIGSYFITADVIQEYIKTR
jgi:hypothetical protein